MTTTAAAPSRSLDPLRRNPSKRTNRHGEVLRGSKPARTVAFAGIVILGAAWLLPLAWAVATSFKPESETTTIPSTWVPESGYTTDAYAKVFADERMWTWMFNSLFTASLITLLTVTVSALGAYAFSRMRFRGRRILMTVTVAAIMVPPQILIVPLFQQMITMHLVDTYWGIILPQLVMPAMVFIMKSFFDGIPRELEDAARMDGSGPLRIFLQIILPLSRPILAAVSIFVFITAWNNFLWPFIVTSDPELMTLPVGLTSVQGAYGLRYAQIMAAAVVAALPLIVLYMLFQRQIIRGVATTGLAGQ